MAYSQKMDILRTGGTLASSVYDPNADMQAHSSSLRRPIIETETYLSKSQLEDLRRVQNERVEFGKRKTLGMDVSKTLGGGRTISSTIVASGSGKLTAPSFFSIKVRMDGSSQSSLLSHTLSHHSDAQHLPPPRSQSSTPAENERYPMSCFEALTSQTRKRGASYWRHRLNMREK